MDQGRAREIPIRNEEQGRVLDDANRFAGRGDLIPAGPRSKALTPAQRELDRQARLTMSVALGHARE